jgi:hypothetical protein
MGSRSRHRASVAELALMRRQVEAYGHWPDHPADRAEWTCGSGYLLGGRLVLTAAHVVCPGGRPVARVQVRDESGLLRRGCPGIAGTTRWISRCWKSSDRAGWRRGGGIRCGGVSWSPPSQHSMPPSRGEGMTDDRQPPPDCPHPGNRTGARTRPPSTTPGANTHPLLRHKKHAPPDVGVKDLRPYAVGLPADP